MKLAAYLRVSTDTQADGLGLDIQEQAIEQWARHHGHRVDCHAADVGVSGSNGLEHRVGLPEIFAWLKDGDVHGIVVYRLDRLARDLIVQEQLLAEFRKMGAAVFSTSDSESQYLEDDPRDPSRKLIRQVLGAVSEYERSIIRLRLDAGRARKRAEGRYADGAPPYGYRAVDGELEPVDAEQNIIRLVHEWRGLDPQWSWARIATELNAEHVPTQRGGRWHPDSVRRIALRPRESEVSDSERREMLRDLTPPAVDPH